MKDAKHALGISFLRLQDQLIKGSTFEPQHKYMGEVVWLNYASYDDYEFNNAWMGEMLYY